jgi:hypothetical protein
MKDFLDHEINTGDKVAMVGGECNHFNIGVVRKLGRVKATVDWNDGWNDCVAIRFPEQLIVLKEERVL